MAHRGRISILHNVLGKSLKSICNDFSEVDEQYGDVKYHLGTRAIVTVNYTSSMDEDKDEDHENRGKRGDLDRVNDGINGEGVNEGYGNGKTIYNNDSSNSISSSSSSSSSSNSNGNSCSDMRTKTLKINLAANPSHLEAVNAVVLGRCKLSSFISIFVSLVLSNLSIVASIY